MTGSRVERYCELALADCAVLVAGIGSAELTERERKVITHTVHLMDAIAHNTHQRNVEMLELLAWYRSHYGEPPGPTDEMSVCA